MRTQHYSYRKLLSETDNTHGNEFKVFRADPYAPMPNVYSCMSVHEPLVACFRTEVEGTPTYNISRKTARNCDQGFPSHYTPRLLYLHRTIIGDDICFRFEWNETISWYRSLLCSFPAQPWHSEHNKFEAGNWNWNWKLELQLNLETANCKLELWTGTWNWTLEPTLELELQLELETANWQLQLESANW